MSAGIPSAHMPSIAGHGDKEMARAHSAVTRKTRKVKLTVYIPEEILEEFKDALYRLCGYRHGILSEAVTEALVLWTKKANELFDELQKTLRESEKAAGNGGEAE